LANQCIKNDTFVKWVGQAGEMMRHESRSGKKDAAKVKAFIARVQAACACEILQ
jgi:hypothetical protein